MEKQTFDVLKDLPTLMKGIAEVTGVSEADVLHMYEQAKNGESFAALFNVSTESLESVYSLAYTLFDAGKWDDALTLFGMLCELRPENPKYWIGFGCAQQKLGEHLGAFMSFTRAADLEDATNPKSLYLLAQSCCSLNQHDAARTALEMAMTTVSENNPVHEQYRKFAQDLLKTITSS